MNEPFRGIHIGSCKYEVSMGNPARRIQISFARIRNQNRPFLFHRRHPFHRSTDSIRACIKGMNNSIHQQRSAEQILRTCRYKIHTFTEGLIIPQE